MSFKYRFILSFVLIEIFFILLIVSVNYFTIKNSSEKLIIQNIKSNITFLNQMVRVPISIYDLASLDNIVETATDLPYINSMIILNNQDKVLSKSYNFKDTSAEELYKNRENKSIIKDGDRYEIRHVTINEEELKLGSFYVVFDVSENSKFINESQEITIFIILVEVLLSTLLSYFIGNRLTNALAKLAQTANRIGKNKDTIIPFQERTDEIGILSKSMQKMQIDLKNSNNNLVKIAEDLEVEKKELIIANKSKDDFLANMSHELKTPLNSINIISSIMMKNTKNTLNDTQIKNLSIINNCGNDLLFLINDVLDVSKLEAGKLKIIKESLNFKLIMTDIKTMFEPQFKDKSIDFSFEYDESIGYICSDEQRIKQIVKNLLSNASKFAKNGAVKFLVKDDNKYINIIVQDNGIGINKEKLEHIFDRFKQVDGSTTRTYGGTGLGLAICKELSELLGGSISVSSEENIGSIFSIRIPKNDRRNNCGNNSENHDKNDNRIVNEISNTTIENKQINNIKIKQSNKINIENNKLDAKTILILSNDPISFMKLVIELKKNNTLIQSNNLKSFLDNVESNKEIDLIIIDNTSIESDELDNIINNSAIKFILIGDAQLKYSDNEKIISCIKKPFLINDVLNKINI